MRHSPDPLPDLALLRDFAAGRHDALGELADRHERSLLGLACGLLGGRRDLARDAVQEMWVRVMRFASGFQGRSGVKTWLYRVLINQCRSMLESERLTLCPAGTISDEQRNESSTTQPAPADLDARERIDGLRRQVEQLDAEKRVVLLLCYHEGLTHEQAAEILGLPLGTLKSRLHAALSELRTALGAREAV